MISIPRSVLPRFTSPSLVPAPLVACLLAVVAAGASPAAGQSISLPRASPHARVQTTLGLTEVTLDYHRPGVKGRQIWGALVPWDAVWRAGANENTTVSFSQPVTIEGRDLAAGTYGLHMIPSQGEWTLIFSTNHTSWGSFFYDEEEDALRVRVTPTEGPHEEWLRYGFTDLTDRSATAYLAWEKVRVPFHIATDTPAIVLANARNELRSQPAFSWLGWYQAAQYALQQDVALEEALGWIDNSIRREQRAQNLFVKARLLEKLDRGGEARELMAKALEEGSENDLNAMGYLHLQGGEVERAIDIFQRNVERHPGAWNCRDSLGEAYAAAGDAERAVESYRKALEMAPDAQKPRIEGILQSLGSP